MISGEPRATPVAILGAGLTGMSAALALQRAQVPFRIFEQHMQAGGHAVTLEEDGYRFDRTGHLLHLRHEELRKEVIGWLAGETVNIERKSRVFSQGVYTHYPFQANTFGLPKAVVYACLLGFIQATTRGAQPKPRNFEEFCRQHFGDGISEHFMLPYNARLWGVPPAEITSDWCQRFVPIPSLEEVLAGALGQPSRELGYNTHFIYPRRGIGQLSLAMQAQIPNLELGRAPQRIDLARRSLEFDTENVDFNVLISSLPLPKLIELLDEPPKAVLDASRRLRCTHLYYLDVALRAPCPQDLHWVYVPEPKYPFYRVGCYSNFSKEMAPPGCANLYVELASREPPMLSEVLPKVIEGLLELQLIGSPEDVAFARVRRIDHAYVIFDQGYFEALSVITPFLEQERILSTGRYGGWNYSSMEDALVFGRAAAKKAVEWLV